MQIQKKTIYSLQINTYIKQKTIKGNIDLKMPVVRSSFIDRGFVQVQILRLQLVLDYRKIQTEGYYGAD